MTEPRVTEPPVTEADVTETDGAGVELAAAKVRGYQIILPPGWVQYPVRRGLAATLFEHVRSVLQNPDNHEVLAQLRTITHRAIKDLVDHGGIDLFLPEKTRSAAAVPASLTSTLVQLGDRGIDAAVTHLSRGRTVDTIEVHTGSAYRWQTTTPGKDELTGLESTNVFYLFPMPGDAPAAGVMFTFGVLKSDELPTEYVEVLYLIFDAMMQSLIWMHDEDD